MRSLLRALGAYFRVDLALMFQYRGEMILWALWGVVYPAVAIAMWSAAARASPDAATIRGYGPRDFAAYFLLTMVVGHFCTAWDIYEMGYIVRSGSMSVRLLRPLLPLWNSVAANAAFKVLTLAILLPIWALVAWVTDPALHTTVAQAACGVAALLLAAIINFIWGYNLSLCAFWVTRMDGMGELWFGASLFFGGRLAPLTLFPDLLQAIAAFLPFKWVVWFPAAVCIGRLDSRAVAAGLLAQTAWVAGGLLLFRLLWQGAVKRYSAVGA
ncbi:MAG: ABC-2 family transporter protein [Planctomycetes bacterium]|nr:ABC-2 family transporter protein [Planctomycetota bacterium]